MKEHEIGNSGPFAMEANEVTRILNAIDAEAPRQAEALIPLVYNELRRLARHKLSMEPAGQTLQATALVHEAYLRLVKPEVNNWNNRQHFFKVAAQAMRRILIDNARRKKSDKRWGGAKRTLAELDELPIHESELDLLDLDQALEAFSKVDSTAAELVQLRFFAGLTSKQAAEVLGVSPRTANNLWAYARAWLYKRLQMGE